MSTPIVFDAAKCTACGACAVACMDLNDIDIPAGQAPYRRVRIVDSPEGTVYLSGACLHCDDAPCAAACPKKCFYRDEQSGLVLYDNTDCIGCRLCARACPHDAVSFRPCTDGGRVKRKMEKCHGCPPWLSAGELPPCVRVCPTGALRVRKSE